MSMSTAHAGGFPWLYAGLLAPAWGAPLVMWLFSEDGPRWFHAFLNWVAA